MRTGLVERSSDPAPPLLSCDPCPNMLGGLRLPRSRGTLHAFIVIHYVSKKEYLLRKSKVAMYISERINIETLAMFKDCERVPFSRKRLPKLGDQMYTTKDGLCRYNSCAPASILT